MLVYKPKQHSEQCTQGFLRRFKDPIRVPIISNWVPRIRKNYHRVPKISENRVTRLREIGSQPIRTGCIYLTFSFKKLIYWLKIWHLYWNDWLKIMSNKSVPKNNNFASHL